MDLLVVVNLVKEFLILTEPVTVVVLQVDGAERLVVIAWVDGAVAEETAAADQAADLVELEQAAAGVRTSLLKVQLV
jgi:hypothetical protein